MTTGIDAILFDLGNVLLTLDWERAAGRLSERAGRSAGELLAYAQAAPAVRELSVGRISRQEFFQECVRGLGFRGSAGEFEEMWSDMFHPNEPMLALARSLKGKLPRVLLSNTNAIHMRAIFARFPELGELEGHVLSHEVGYEKPDPRIYQHALRRHRLRASRTVFVDDLAENVAGAQAVGLRAIQYRDAAQTLAALAALGVG